MTRPRRSSSAPAPRDDAPPPVAVAKTAAAAPPARPRRKTAAIKAGAAPLPDPVMPAKPRRKTRSAGSVKAGAWPADEFIFGADRDLPDHPGVDSPPGPRRQTDRRNQPETGIPVPQVQFRSPDRGEAAQERARIRAGMQEIRQLIDGPTDRSGAGAMLMLQRLCHDPLPRRRLAGSAAQGLVVPPPAPPMPMAVRPTKAARALPAGRQRPGQGKTPDHPRAAAVPALATPTGWPEPQVMPQDLPDLWTPDLWMPGIGVSEIRMPATGLAPQPVVTSFTVAYPAPLPDQAGPAPGATAPVRSRINRLLAAWADWLMWRLQPPRIPQAVLPVVMDPRAQAAPDAEGTPVFNGETVSAGSCPDKSGGGDGAEQGPQTAAPEPGPAAEAADRVQSHEPKPSAMTAPAAAISQTPDIVLTGDALAKALSAAIGKGTLRDHLQAMIRDELAGEMGARFSGNLQAVIRREVANGLDDRLTHL